MMIQRRRIKYIVTFEERLAQEAREFKKGGRQATGWQPARELLLRRVRQAETGSNISKWISSPGLRPPEALRSLLAK